MVGDGARHLAQHHRRTGERHPGGGGYWRELTPRAVLPCRLRQISGNPLLLIPATRSASRFHHRQGLPSGRCVTQVENAAEGKEEDNQRQPGSLWGGSCRIFRVMKSTGGEASAIRPRCTWSEGIPGAAQGAAEGHHRVSQDAEPAGVRSMPAAREPPRKRWGLAAAGLKDRDQLFETTKRTRMTDE